MKMRILKKLTGLLLFAGSLAIVFGGYVAAEGFTASVIACGFAFVIVGGIYAGLSLMLD